MAQACRTKRELQEGSDVAKKRYPACGTDATVTPCCNYGKWVPRPWPSAKTSDEEYQPGLFIRGDEETRKVVREHLDMIKVTNTGKKLLNRLLQTFKKAKKKVMIQEELSESGHADPLVREAAYPAGSHKYSHDPNDPEACIEIIDGNGKGSDSLVYYNTTQTRIGLGSEKWRKRPPAIGLAHELIHAMHETGGTLAPTYHGKIGDQERQAIGLDPCYADDEITENKIRDEWPSGPIDRRPYHSSPDENVGESGPPEQ